MTRPKHVTVELTYGQARSLQKLLKDLEGQLSGTPDIEHAIARIGGLRGRVNAAIKRAKDEAIQVAWQAAVQAPSRSKK